MSISTFPPSRFVQSRELKQYKFGPLRSSVAQLCLWLCSCTWASPWAPEERTAWSRSEKRSSFLCSRSTCCWRASVPRSRTCRTWSSSRTAPESRNAPVYSLSPHSFLHSRLAFFELNFQFYTTQQLQWEVIRHYSKQVTHPQSHKVLLWGADNSKGVPERTLTDTDSSALLFQAIKQMYVLVLGLDVLGNPFGLIRGLSEGFEAFFYEPYQVGCRWTQEP